MRLHRSIAPLFVETKTESSNQVSNSRRSPPVYSTSLNDPSKQQQLISPHLVKVADYLFLGSIEAAFDEPLLCRNEINSVVDLSALQPNQVARNRKSSCPCACSLQVTHSRARLTVPIQDRESQDISPYLSDINTFVHAWRTRRKNVLVFSNRGQSRAPAIIIQYLIQIENVSLNRTLVQLTSLRPSIKINKGFLKILKEIERKQMTPAMISNPVHRCMKFDNYQTNERTMEEKTRTVAWSASNILSDTEMSESLKRAWA